MVDISSIIPRDNARHKVDRPWGQDWQCALWFLVMAAGMAYTSIWSLSTGQGNIDRLTHAMDFQGNICGKSPATLNRSFLYVCGKAEAAMDQGFPKHLDFKSRTCVAECPTSNETAIPCISRPYVFPHLNPAGVGTDGVQYLESMTFEISQSVSYQAAYPTELYRGSMCVPPWNAPNGLRDALITGPHSSMTSLAEGFGSITTAWPVLLGAALLANILGYLYLRVMKLFAGPLLLGSLFLGAAFIGFVGLFLSLGIFFNPYDEASGYYQWNPIFRSVYGEASKVLSFFLGLLLVATAALMVRTARHSVERIDESVGMIDVALKCLFDRNAWFTILLIPLISALAILSALAVLLYFFMVALSVGNIASHQITVNSNQYASLQEDIAHPDSWSSILFLYAFGVVWIVEILIATTQFITSYEVICWFFTDIQRADNPDSVSKPFAEAYKGHGEKVENVRVHGVDAVAGGRRTGYVEEDTIRGRGKVLVVPIGRKHPDGRDFLPEIAYVEEKAHECTWGFGGLCLAIKCFGILVAAAWPVCLTRPLRMIAQIIKFLLTPASSVVVREKYEEEDVNSIYQILVGFGGLVSSWINHKFGGLSKDAYADVILRGTDFQEAAGDVQEFVLRSGGVVAFLHGMTSIYEIISVAFITMISTFVAYICMTNIGSFNDPASDLYIEDPGAMTWLACLISLIISFNWMSLFNNTADTILYTFAWSRKQQGADNFPTLMGDDNDDGVMPGYLLAMLKTELDEAPLEAMKGDSQAQLTRFNHAHKKFASSVWNYTTAGKGGQLTFGDGEREPMLTKTRGGTNAGTNAFATNA